MYAGPFNLNIYLRTFVRGDIVDDYERKCRDIVKKYEGAEVKDAMPKMIAELNQALVNMWDSIQLVMISQEEGNNE